jgi:arylsulfatase A-like enzyme
MQSLITYSILLSTVGVHAVMDRPNFVIIMADDLGYGDLGCYGGDRIATPHLDRLAAEGMRFTDFHSSGAVCSPTRAGLMTGRYQQRAGIPAVIFADSRRETHPHGLQDGEVTFAELLREAGYRTAVFGKWHLGYYKKYNPIRHGFGQFRGYVSGNVDFFSHVDQTGRFDWWRDDSLEDELGYTTHLITRHALRFIEDHQSDPFCLYLPYEPPHYPYQGPNDSPIRAVGAPRGLNEMNLQAGDIRRAYREMVEAMDQGIGEILSQLRTHGWEKETLVMFLSDNGATVHGSNGMLRGHKGQLWEGGHRVPLIASWPGVIPEGAVSNELTISLDIMPTLLEASQLRLPVERHLDGRSLLGHLTEAKNLRSRRLFWAHGNWRAVRDGPWKAILGGDLQPALFNLDNDLGEQANLADQEVTRLKEMLSAVEGWEADVTTAASVQPNMPPVDRP